MRHHAEFRADRSNQCGDMVVFNFSRWRLSAIFDLFWTKQEEYLVVLSLC